MKIVLIILSFAGLALLFWRLGSKVRVEIAAPEDVSAPPSDATEHIAGLWSKVLEPGSGERNPLPNSKVMVHYTGWTTDGRMFDSSVVRGQPAVFGLQQVIIGWREGVALMVEGEQRRFWIAQELAYPQGPGPRGMLVFDVTLLSILD